MKSNESLASSSSSAIVFVDASVENYQQIVDSAIEGTEVVILNTNQDGIEQITTVLATANSKAAVHLVCHGAPGQLFLGNRPLSLATIDRYTAQLKQWFRHAGSLPSLLLYSCRVAAGEAGAELITRLQHLTGANIAASRSQIGHAALGGQWQLEVTTGKIAPIAFQPEKLAQYAGVLESIDPAEIELVGGSVNGDDPQQRLSTWFPGNGLGTNGGADGVADDSSGFGIRFCGALGFTSPIDNGLVLFVNNKAFATPNNRVEWDKDKNTVTTGIAEMSGLQVQTQYFVDRGFAKPVLRSYTTFINPSDAPITASVSWVSNSKSNDQFNIQATSSGDATLALGDRWVITDDQEIGSVAPAMAYVFNGPDSPAVIPTSVSQSAFEKNGREGIRADYSVTIPANSTRALLFFNIQGDTPTRAQNSLGLLDEDPRNNSLLRDLTDQQRYQVLNWNFGAGIITTSVQGNTTEAGGAATFDITLSKQPTANVTVSFTSDDPTEGNLSAPSLTFTPANWNTPQTLTVTGVDDLVDDGDVSYKIRTSFTSTDAVYKDSSPVSLTVLNADNDVAGITVSPASSNTTEAGGAATFALSLNSQPTADVVINLTSTNPSEGTVASSATFTVGNWNTPQTITVTGVDDVIDDGDVSYSIQTTVASADAIYAAIDPADISFLNIDNDQSNQPADKPGNKPDDKPGNKPDEPENKPPILVDDSSNDGKVEPPANVVRIKGTVRKDNLTGSAQDEVFLGLAGDDRILAGAGNDFLNAGAGNDRLLGEAGSDLLIGGKGRNQLIGGADQDVFVLQAKQSLAIIGDFENGVDRLSLSKGLTYKNIDISQQGQKTIVTFNDSVLAILNGVNSKQISIADFVKI